MEQERLNEEARIAVLEARVDDTREEVTGIRARLHDLTSRVKGLEFIADEVKRLTGSVDQMRSEMPKIVRDNSREVAEDVMERGTAKREALERQRWGLKIQWIGTGIALGSLVVSLIYLFVK